MPTTQTFPRIALLLTFYASLVVTGRVAAIAPTIQDEAKLFSPATVEQADETIQEISRRYHGNLVVQTFSSPSRWKTFVLKLKSPQTRGRFYEDWAKELARKAGPDSIVVLICKEPSPLHVEVAAGRNARRHGFSAAKCRQLQETLLAQFQHGEFDRGLLDAVEFARATLRAPFDDRGGVADSFSWPIMLGVIFILLSVWIGLGSMQRYRPNPSETESISRGAIGYGAGGSYLAGVFAGMNTPWVRDLIDGLRMRRAPNLFSAPSSVSSQELDHPSHQDLPAHPPEERAWLGDGNEPPDQEVSVNPHDHYQGQP